MVELWWWTLLGPVFQLGLRRSADLSMVSGEMLCPIMSRSRRKVSNETRILAAMVQKSRRGDSLSPQHVIVCRLSAKVGR